MRAVRFHEYGEPQVLTVEDAPEPHAGAGQVRIRVQASSVNSIDWKLRAGYLHEMMPLTFPAIPGQDAAGVVDEVGDGVTGVQAGDLVFGLAQGGAAAQFAVLAGWASVPSQWTVQQAAAAGLVAATAGAGLAAVGGLSGRPSSWPERMNALMVRPVVGDLIVNPTVGPPPPVRRETSCGRSGPDRPVATGCCPGRRSSGVPANARCPARRRVSTSPRDSNSRTASLATPGTTSLQVSCGRTFTAKRLIYLAGWRDVKTVAKPASARARLLEASARLFYAQGMAATGIDAIIAEAGVAKMSLYNNFASKDDLVATYIRARHEEWLELYRARIQDGASPTDGVLAVFDAYIDQASLAYPHGFRGCGLLNAAAELPAGSPGRDAVRRLKEQVERS